MTGTTIASVLLGAMAGFAVGMYVAQRVGGFRGLTARLRSKGAAAGTEAEAGDQYDEIEEDGALLDEDGDDIGMTAESDEDAEFNGMDATDDDAAETPLILFRSQKGFFDVMRDKLHWGAKGGR